MATLTVTEFRSVTMMSGGVAQQVAVLPELSATVLDTAGTKTLVIDSDTTLIRVRASGDVKMSARSAAAATAGSIVIGDGETEYFGVSGSPTLFIEP